VVFSPRPQKADPREKRLAGLNGTGKGPEHDEKRKSTIKNENQTTRIISGTGILERRLSLKKKRVPKGERALQKDLFRASLRSFLCLKVSSWEDALLRKGGVLFQEGNRFL